MCVCVCMCAYYGCILYTIVFVLHTTLPVYTLTPFFVPRISLPMSNISDTTKFKVGNLVLDSDETRRARVLYDYDANGYDELSVSRDQVPVGVGVGAGTGGGGGVLLVCS